MYCCVYSLLYEKFTRLNNFQAGDHTDISTPSGIWVDDTEEDYSWIMQQPGDAPDLPASATKLTREDERRNAWRTEVRQN